MHRPRLARFFVAFACLLIAGCGRESRATAPLPLKVLDREGVAAIEFGSWLLVFEEIPANSVSVGAQCTLSCPAPQGGESDHEFGALRIKQSWNESVNRVEVNGRAFALAEGGREVTFPDRTYKIEGDTRRTILIKKGGSTRDQAGG